MRHGPLQLAVPLCLFLASAARAAGADAGGLEFFEKKVRPVLVEHCYKCHSAEAGQKKKLKGGLLLDTRARALKGGDSEKPAVVPGDAEASLLIEAVRWKNEDLQMPPKQKLSDAQIADLVAWVNMGAPDPRVTGASPAPPAAARAGDFWSFKPPQPRQVPAVKDSGRVQSPVDAFVLARLAEKDLGLSPPADKRTLIRRATYDLHGLPPAPEEVDAFVADESPDAFARLVDRLLASPRYGERWGRHWLDLARYSDTKGYVYSDREEARFVHSHAYRDWVIGAFHADLPYDQFLLKQIAADQLLPPGKTVGVAEDASGAVNDPSLAAMGFLTIGRRFLGVPHDIIDDRIDVVTRTTQGLTVGCARCHDHKYDPIPTADYYSLYGVFAASSERLVPLSAAPERTDAYLAYEKGLNERVRKLNDTFEKLKGDLLDKLRLKAGDYLLALLEPHKLPEELFYIILEPDDVNPVIARQWQAYLFHKAKAFDPIFAPWTELSKLPQKDFEAQAARVLAELAAGGKVHAGVAKALTEDPPNSMADVAKAYGKLLAEVDKEWRETIKKDPSAASLPDADREALRLVLYGPDSPVNVPAGSIIDTSWFFGEKGKVELGKLQSEVEKWINAAPGAPPHAVILEDRPSPQPNPRIFKRGNPTAKAEEVPRRYLQILCGPDRKPFERGSGRLEMAKLIASADNPLTARVMVNRIWLHHFGRGLVATPSDFGTRSDPPSHPELLDWLAVRFVNDGWSIKKMHRLIMLSSAYQQASGANSAAAAVDPENRLLWRQNRQRLDFESMRDSVLAASGGLDLTMGGRPVEMFKPPFSNRRTVYGLIDRQFLPGVFRLFDFANPDLHSPQRYLTTVPQQALFFMNSPFMTERARALAKRSEVKSATDPADRVRRMYRLVYQRPATDAQVAAALEFLSAAQDEPTPEPPKPVSPDWKYGYGEFDEASQKMKSFEPLPFFTGDAWQGGPTWPDAKLGWVRLTADGGHAGNDLQHAAVRRWVAPREGTFSVSGSIRHDRKGADDGVRARVVSSRDGQLAAYVLHGQTVEMKFEPLALKKGDTLDFVVDIRGTLNNDDFTWSPMVKALEKPPAEAGEKAEWDAKKDFAGKPAPAVQPLTAWERYAQVLLLSNEFLFID